MCKIGSLAAYATVYLGFKIAFDREPQGRQRRQLKGIGDQGSEERPGSKSKGSQQPRQGGRFPLGVGWGCSFLFRGREWKGRGGRRASNLNPAGAQRKECHAYRRRKMLPHCLSDTRAVHPPLCHHPAPSRVRSWQTWAFEKREKIQKFRMCSKQISVLAEVMRALFLSACGKLHYRCRTARRGSVPSVLCSWGEALLNARLELSL